MSRWNARHTFGSSGYSVRWKKKKRKKKRLELTNHQSAVTVIAPDGKPFRMSVSDYRDFNKTPKEIERQRQIDTLRKLPYEEYLKSPHWQIIRRRKLKLANYRCERCGKDKCELHIHHKRYDNRGCEPMIDLLAFCFGCHKRHHGIIN